MKKLILIIASIVALCALNTACGGADKTKAVADSIKQSDSIKRAELTEQGGLAITDNVALAKRSEAALEQGDLARVCHLADSLRLGSDSRAEELLSGTYLYLLAWQEAYKLNKKPAMQRYAADMQSAYDTAKAKYPELTKAFTSQFGDNEYTAEMFRGLSADSIIARVAQLSK